MYVDNSALSVVVLIRKLFYQTTTGAKKQEQSSKKRFERHRICREYFATHLLPTTDYLLPEGLATGRICIFYFIFLPAKWIMNFSSFSHFHIFGFALAIAVFHVAPSWAWSLFELLITKFMGSHKSYPLQSGNAMQIYKADISSNPSGLRSCQSTVVSCDPFPSPFLFLCLFCKIKSNVLVLWGKTCFVCWMRNAGEGAGEWPTATPKAKPKKIWKQRMGDSLQKIIFNYGNILNKCGKI